MPDIKNILKQVQEGIISIEVAEKLLSAKIIEEIGDLAKLDINRVIRTGIPEVLYAQDKNPELVLEIIHSFLKKNNFCIVSRYTESQKNSIIKKFQNSEKYDLISNDIANIFILKDKSFNFVNKGGKIGIITAGSSDIQIAEEAKVICQAMGCEVKTSYDVGIAGIHRLFNPLSDMIKSGVHVIIVCAGMEGTLPGLVAALVDVPVIGVPISSGYGMGEKGRGALTTMLQSCSPGLLVVNIDNGFGAGASAAIIANKIIE